MVYSIGGEMFNYRRVVYVRNRNNNNLVDFQIAVELFEDFDWSNVKTDGSDIRFGDETGKFPYWIETWDYGNYAKIWVKVPEIPALSTIKFYMYYGNADTQSESDGEAVFDFFDDFNTFDITKYVNDFSSVADRDTDVDYIFNNEAYAENSELVMRKTLQAMSVADISLNNVELQQMQIVEVKARAISGADWSFILGVGYTNNLVYVFYSNYADTINVEYELNSTTTHIADIEAYDNEYYIYAIARRQNDYVIKVIKDNSELINVTANISYDTNKIFMSQSSYTNSTEETRVDWIRIRKYAEIEPVTFVGLDEPTGANGGEGQPTRVLTTVRNLPAVRELDAKRVILV